MSQHNDRPQPYWDETRQKWMVDDYGRPREASPEEIEPARRERK